ncbi:hypothetical protein BP6252_02756 [Coleophoma cylindrospora]|uniref:Uncharacterized protein n=1 Tax=Coleophoma cylindrospora TaxID=1849047 RepID=A0A3D8SFV3_9HELO|nr:hypothetical protein BP6252_02756 [Coleophoma cylindrospora]
MGVWLITGCSSGFGLEVAKAALAHGDQVIATSRDVSKLSELRDLGAATLALNISASSDVLNQFAAEAVKIYGKIDILLNNAGYILEAAVEEATMDQVKAQFATNLFAHIAVTQAFLPYMRAQRSGVIANMGSIAGWTGIAGGGHYCASKFALVGITETLRKEVSHLNIKVTIIEPGYFRTNFLTPGLGNRTIGERIIDDLKPVMDPFRAMLGAADHKQPGDVKKGAQLIVEALTGTGRCAGKELPCRLLLGKDAVDLCSGVVEDLRKDIEEWRELSTSTDHDDV